MGEAASPAGPPRGARVLVTGATGFIGGHLAAHLSAERGCRVVGTGRDFSGAGFLAEAGVEPVRADLLEPGPTAEAADGCELVFHAAAWMGGGDGSKAERINVDATARLVRAAARAGARRFVHVSSVAAYGVPDRAVIEEDHPLATRIDEPYARTKARGEVAARAVADELGMELAVVRPAYVYGPRSTGWTVRMFERVRKGFPVLIGDGAGSFHQIYVDDVVELLVRCGGAPGAAGQAFNASGPPTTWRHFVGRYGRMCGREARSVPLWLARAVAWLGDHAGLSLPIDRTRLAQATARTEFSTRQARDRLGWRPRVDLEEGMRRTEAWLQAEGYL